MGSLPEPSNEQKLTFIYQILKEQESRRKRKIFYGFLKWMLLFSLFGFIYVYRVPLISRSATYIQNAVHARIKQISEEQKAGILKGIQQLLPPSLENTLRDVQKSLAGTGAIDSTKKDTPPEEAAGVKKTTTTTKKTGVKK